MDVDGLEAVEADSWKGTASGFIPVERFVEVFKGCSFDDGCCPPQMLP